MNEGWANDEHFIVFNDEESREATLRYGLAERLPRYTIVGLRGWDDFVVRDSNGQLFSVPTVPLIPKYLEPFPGDLPSHLTKDQRAGTIKWYVKPIVFGGSAEIGENLTWITHAQHTELVRWWNHQYDVTGRSAQCNSELHLT
jgi:hypothetical protein